MVLSRRVRNYSIKHVMEFGGVSRNSHNLVVHRGVQVSLPTTLVPSAQEEPHGEYCPALGIGSQNTAFDVLSVAQVLESSLHLSRELNT